MKISFLIKESLQTLRHNILRSMLTVIGIIVGIISVTAMLGLGGGLSASILDRFSSFATGDLSVSGKLTYNDLSWVSEQPYVSKAMAKKTVSGVTTIMSSTDFSPTITTVVGDYTDIQSYDLIAGDIFDFQDPEFSERVAIVTTDFQEAVSEETGQNTMVGQTLTIGGQQYQIIGLIEVSAAGFGGGNDGEIIVPYATAVGTLSGTKEFSTINVLLKDSSYYEIAGKDILAGLNAARYLAVDSEDTFSVQTAQSIIESAQETTQMITLFLGIVGGIALFVGGIGTMNMMLTTVIERTKEIGLRKAVGARDLDILLQILTESVLLTAFGGIVGIIIAIGGSSLANQVLANSNFVTIIISWQVIFFAAFIAIAVGVVFGVYPARRAAKLQPVDALRSE